MLEDIEVTLRIRSKYVAVDLLRSRKGQFRFHHHNGGLCRLLVKVDPGLAGRQEGKESRCGVSRVLSTAIAQFQIIG